MYKRTLAKIRKIITQFTRKDDTTSLMFATMTSVPKTRLPGTINPPYFPVLLGDNESSVKKERKTISVLYQKA